MSFDYKAISGKLKSAELFEKKPDWKYMKTSFPWFNEAMEIGGAPVNCVWEIHGPNMGGKTTFGIGLLVDAQKAGHAIMLVDAENRANKEWASTLGLDLESCLYSRPDNYEQAAKDVRIAIKNFKAWKKKSKKSREDTLMFILIDSITSLVPKAELEGDVGKANFGLQSALTSQFLRILSAEMRDSDVALICINQERANVGAGMFEPKHKSALGEALQFYASVRIRMTLEKSIKEEISGKKVEIGKIHRGIVEKNTVGPNKNVFKYYLSTGRGEAEIGFDKRQELFDYGVECGYIEKDGSSYDIPDYEYSLSNRPEALREIRSNDELFNKLKEKLDEY